MADVNISIALAGITAIEKELGKLRTEMDGLGKTGVSTSTNLNQVAGGLANVGTKLSLMAVPVAALGASIIKSGADFESAMNKISVATGATAEDMKKVEEAAIRIGDTTTFSAGEAADAMINLGKNGVTLEEQFGGVLDATVDLAAATGTSLAGAADIASKAMDQFGASAEDLPTMMNQMFNATQESTFSLGDMALALSQGGGAAATAGLSFAEFNTAMVTVSSNVSAGSDAGTAFKSMLIALLAPTKEAAELQKVLGINIKDAHGNIIPMRDVVGQLTTALEGQGGAQKLATAATLAGSDAQRGITALVRGGVAEWDKNTAAINKSGTAHAAATKMMEGFWGAVDKLTGALEKVGIALLKSGFIQFLTDLIEGLAKAIDWVSKLDPVIVNLGAALGTAAVVGGPLLVLVSSLLVPIGLLSAPIIALAAGITALATGFIHFSDAIGTAFHRSVANAYDVLRSLGSVIGVEIPERMLKFGASFAEVPENVTQSMAYTAKAVKDSSDKIGPAIKSGVADPIGKAADTFEEQSNKISAKYKEMAEEIADNESLGLDEKIAAFSKLGQELHAMGEVGKEAANELRDAIKQVAAESATAEIAKIVNDVTLSYGDQLDAVEALLPAYENLGKFGADAVAKIKAETATLQSEMMSHIKDADWGLDEKIKAFDTLEASMENTGNNGAKAMDALKESISDTIADSATAELQGILDSYYLTTIEQIDAVDELRKRTETYGTDATKALQGIQDAAEDLNAELADKKIQAILDDTTLSLEQQLDAIEDVRDGAQKLGADGGQAFKDAGKEADDLAKKIEKSNNVLYGVQTALNDNIIAWGGWGDSAGRIVTGFSAAFETGLSEMFLTGEFQLEEFGLALKQVLADEAAKTIINFVSLGIKKFIEWGTIMFAQMLTGASGMDIAAASAVILDLALAPILIVVVAIAAAIGILLLLGVDLGEIFDWIAGYAKYMGEFLLEFILAPVNLLIAGFKALCDLLGVFVKWIGTIGDALGKGDLKDLFKIFEGFNPLKGIGDFFGGLFGGLFHEGGLIPGKGEIAIRAEGGEFVMSKAATDMFGPLLKAMNDRGLGKSMNVAVVHAGDVAKADPFKAFASGGDMMLTRPTLLLGGESGPEMVSFRHGQRGNDATVVNNGILVADRLTLNQLGKKLYRNAQRDQLRTRKR